MRTGRSPGARSGPKLSGWYVDAVNDLAGAGFCESSPRASAQGERTIRDRLGRGPSSRAGMLTLSTIWPEPVFARAAPEPLHRARGRSGTDSAFYIRPYVAFPQGGGGECAMLPSMGTEHGVSGELQAGNPSGRPCPVRWGSARGPEARPKVPAEHGVSGELQAGNPSGRPCPVRWGSARGPEARPKVPAGDLPDPVPWRRGPRARCLPPMGFRYKISEWTSVPRSLGVS